MNFLASAPLAFLGLSSFLLACSVDADLGGLAASLNATECGLDALNQGSCLNAYFPPRAGAVVTDGTDASDEFVIAWQPVGAGWLELAFSAANVSSGTIAAAQADGGCGLTVAFFYPSVSDGGTEVVDGCAASVTHTCAGFGPYTVTGEVTVVAGGNAPGASLDVRVTGAGYQSPGGKRVALPDSELKYALGGPAACVN